VMNSLKHSGEYTYTRSNIKYYFPQRWVFGDTLFCVKCGMNCRKTFRLTKGKPVCGLVHSFLCWIPVRMSMCIRKAALTQLVFIPPSSSTCCDGPQVSGCYCVLLMKSSRFIFIAINVMEALKLPKFFS
jgi:hypothetical protein